MRGKPYHTYPPIILISRERKQGYVYAATLWCYKFLMHMMGKIIEL